MSNNSSVNTTFQTTNIFVYNGGEIFLSSETHPTIPRIISAEQFTNGTDVKLILIPGDTYRFRSRSKQDFGSSFTSSEEAINVEYATVNQHGKLVKIITKVGGFVPLHFNHSVTNLIYANIIKELTLGQNLINLAVNEPFSIRDVSKQVSAHLGNNMLLYKVDFKYEQDVFTITSVECLSQQQAADYLAGGLGVGSMMVRQHVINSKAIQVAFEPETSNVHFVKLIEMLRNNVDYASIIRKGDRYNVACDLKSDLFIK